MQLPNPLPVRILRICLYKTISKNDIARLHGKYRRIVTRLYVLIKNLLVFILQNTAIVYLHGPKGNPLDL